MAKPVRTFDSLFDQQEEILSLLDRLFAIVDSKPVTPVTSQSPLLTTRQAAKFLGVSPKTIYNNPDRFHSLKLKQGGLRFRKADLEELVSLIK